MVGTKRQRAPHFIAGLGDGNVHEQPRITNDDVFPASQRLTPYIRKRPTQQMVLPSPRAIFTKDTFSDSGDPTSTDGPWQISAMVLLCLMGLLVGLFLHLVNDSAEKQQFPRRRRARTHSSPTTKKKTDEWSEDEEEVEGDAYRADSEAHSLYYPYRYANQQHRHRTASSNSGTLHHRIYKGPASSRHAAATSQSPGPTLRTTRSTDSGMGLSSTGTRPVIEDMQPTEEELLKSPFRRVPSLHPRPLSPVSSFASMENHSSGMDMYTTHEGDEETGASPIVIANAVSFDASQQSSSRLLNKGTEDDFHDLETPRAGTKAQPAILEQAESYATNLLPPLPLHEERQFLLPYIPDLAAHHSGSEEASVPASEPQAAYPGHIHPLPQSISPQHAASAPASNDPRRNIIHKREDITHCTNAESSLMKSSVDFAEISLDCIIGGGGFGQVWKGTWRSTPVAVKILTGSAQREICDKGILEEFAAEINMLKVVVVVVCLRRKLWCMFCFLTRDVLYLAGYAPSKHLSIHGCLPQATESRNYHRACSERIAVGCSKTSSVRSLYCVRWNDSDSLVLVALFRSNVACESSIATKGHLAVGSCQASGMRRRSWHDVPSQWDSSRFTPRSQIR